MKKNEFIKAVANTAGITQDKTSEVLRSMISIITKELKNEREVNITGF
jgi:nucleoid DNA-binding protein